jgi:hypothetical protein
MTREMRDVLRCLRRGKANALYSGVIRAEAGLPGGRTEEVVRDTIKALIYDEGVPIGSCSRGYYIIETDEELEEVAGDLQNRADGCISRANQIRQNWRGANA